MPDTRPDSVSETPAQKPERYISAADLIARGIVKNTMTLWRWRKSHGFPEPVPLGWSTVRYRESEVEAWIAQRAREAKARPRGIHLKKSRPDPSGAAA